MKWKTGSKFFRWGLTAFLVIAASICFYYIMFHGSNIKFALETVTGILMPIVFGLIIAYLLMPVLNFFEFRVIRPLFQKCKLKESPRRNSLSRGISILITTCLFFALIYVLISMLISEIVPSIVNIVNNFDDYINNFTVWLNRLLEDNPDMRDYVVRTINKYSTELEKWLNETILEKSSELIKMVSLSVIGTLKVLWNLIIGIIISIYVMANKEKFTGQAKKMAYAIFHEDTANIIINNFHFTHRTFSGFISGKVLDSILIGCLCFVGTTLMNTPYALLISVIIGVTNVIPFFGPYLGAIPSILLIFLVDPMHPLGCAYFAIFILALQQLDGNFIGPKILGNSTGLTSFWVIFAITFFGGLLGVFGMIVGVPLFAVLYAAIKSFVNAALMKKGLPCETEKYMNVCAVDEEGLHEYTPEYMQDKKFVSKHPFGDRFLSSMDEITRKKNEKVPETASYSDAVSNITEPSANAEKADEK
ncbi:MAG: AI-2E family transporter [Roseburia sp.]|nr:AI-2E family transporter [Roseburia sp.]